MKESSLRCRMLPPTVLYQSNATHQIVRGHFSGRPAVSNHEAVFLCTIAALRETVKTPSGVAPIAVQLGFNDFKCPV